MEAHLHDWLNLAVRWLHIVTGIAWIGASFYFNWLENHLEREGKGEGIAGSLWAIHGGGFYYLEKYQVAPPRLPTTLHWFKWEAYWTWISGAALLAVVYYLNAGTMMITPAEAAVGPATAVLIGLATLIGSWFVYDGLCRSPLGRRPVLLAVVGFALLVLLAWALSLVFQGRAAYIHVGAAIGTCMVGNVFRVIIPSQKALVAAVEQGGVPDPQLGRNALLRSRHNNYLTLPVLFVMISNHYPSTYAHEWNWLILAAIMLIGAGVRHYFNIRHLPGRKVWMLPTAAAAMIALAVATSPSWRTSASTTSGGTVQAAAPVNFERVRTIIDQRCASCHAANPSQPGFAAPPAGVRLDTEAHIRAQRQAINRVSVQSRYMPLGNITGMTDAERETLRRWLAGGG